MESTWKVCLYLAGYQSDGYLFLIFSDIYRNVNIKNFQSH